MYICVAAAVTAKVLAVEVALELIVELITELKARVKIQQLKEPKVFNSLRLSVVVAARVLVEALAVG